MAEALELLDDPLLGRGATPVLPDAPVVVLPETPAPVLPETALTPLRLELLPLDPEGLEPTPAVFLLPGCCGTRELNEPGVLLRLTVTT